MAAYKIAYELQSQVRSAVASQPLGVIVRHSREAFVAHAAAATREVAVSREFHLVPATAMQLPATQVEALSRDDSVEYIWPDLPVHTCLDVSVPHVRAPQVWNAGFRGDGVKIAILDTGIDGQHADFAGRIKAVTSFADGDGTDDNGHGTHVAGIAAGSGAASNGRYRGVAPGADLYIAKVLDARGNGSMSSVMAGIEWAVDQGVQVINLSLGGDAPADGTDALSTLCDQVVRQLGIVICVAAGNEGPNAATIGPPGVARWVITVGAVTDADALTRFSSRGPTRDGRIKPDIVFPGAGIVAPQAARAAVGRPVEAGYAEMSGTSMATPHATGAVALLLQAQAGLKPEAIRRALVGGAVDIHDLPTAQGSGRGDVYAAYRRAISPLPAPPSGGSGNWLDRLRGVLGGGR
jgi:serine protease AprX